MGHEAAALYLTAEQTEAIRLADEAQRLVEIEEGLAQIEDQWPKALQQAEAATEDDPHAARIGGIEALVHAREFLINKLGGEVEPMAQAQAARGKAAEPKAPDRHDFQQRGEQLHGRLKSLLDERKTSHAKKASGNPKKS